MITAHRLFAAVILAGLFAVIGGAAFADGDLSALPYVAALGHPDVLFALIGVGEGLHRAAAKGNIAQVKRLIDCGADVNVKGIGCWTPLHWAAYKGEIEIADALIKAGADVFACTNLRETALRIAEGRHGENSKIARLLREAMGRQNEQ